jgi:RNA 2',3'-cyclic 3'-phosphodiesterase
VNRSSEPTQRLFFALWPDEQVRARLADAARRWTRKPITDERLHLTLVFLGNRSAAERQCFSEAAATIAGEPFELTLDYLGAWPRRGIRWLGTTHIPEALFALVQELNRVLPPCGYQVEARPDREAVRQGLDHAHGRRNRRA